MKKCLFLSFLFIFCQMVFAQERFTITVKDNEDINSLMSNSRYVFPEFRTGKVIFNDFSTTNARLNYNMLTQEMQYVDAQNRILALVNPAEIASIQIDGREFVYTPRGYAEVLAYAGNKALLLHRRVKVANEKPTGAYGTPSDVSAVERNTTYRFAYDGLSSVTDLGGEQRINLTVSQTIYLISGKTMYTPPSERNFSRLFGGDTRKIQNYVKSNKLDLKKPTDLIEVFNYLADNM